MVDKYINCSSYVMRIKYDRLYTFAQIWKDLKATNSNRGLDSSNSQTWIHKKSLEL